MGWINNLWFGRTTFLWCILCLLFNTWATKKSFAQAEGEGKPSLDSLLAEIEARLDQETADTSIQFIFSLVRGHCGQEFLCQFGAYSKINSLLEARFDLTSAITVANEQVKIAQKAGDWYRLAAAHQNLSRFYGATGEKQKEVVHIEQAMLYFEKSGKHALALRLKFVQLESRRNGENQEEILAKLNALVEKAQEYNDTIINLGLNMRLAKIKIALNKFEEAQVNVDVTEQILANYDPHSFNPWYFINMATIKAQLFRANEDLENAVQFYKKANLYSRIEPDRWLDIYTLISIGELEWELGRKDSSQIFLDTAQVKAEQLGQDDLLMMVYSLKARLAERDGAFEEALAFTKKKVYYEKKHDSKSAGFDVENHYLELEKEQLAVENENKALALALKEVQLRNSLIIISFAFFLAVGLAWAFNSQRIRKQKLAVQNSLIQEQAERLENLDAAKSRFFANVSHELRTPITLIMGPISSLLKEDALSEKQSKLLHLASQSGKQLQQLVTELLDLSKLEMGKMKLDLKPTVVATFFEQYFAQFESLAHGKSITYSFATFIPPDIVANIDQTKCRQILYNLLSNAFKFTPKGGWIKTSLGMNGNELQLIVADSGPGIHPEDIEHLFERYFQTNRQDKPAQGGTGIGLALCYEYAQLFGGDIRVESTLGNGALFRVNFPVQLSKPADIPLVPTVVIPEEEADLPKVIATPVDTRLPGPAGRARVLVVEDNTELQDYIRIVLSNKYEITTASNGQEALSILEAEQGRNHSRFELIISDLMMPIMDGFQLLEAVKSKETLSHIPFIMLTARADASDKLKALRIGVDDYLIKPFDEEELLVRIANLIKNKENRSESRANKAGEKPEPKIISMADQRWLKEFEDYIKKNIADDSLSVQTLIREFAMSESTLLRQLKRLTGLSPNKYLQEVRLNQARKYLENRTFKSVSKVATKVGYGDVRSFSRSFKKRFAKLPSAYLAES